MNILCITHADFESPAVIEQWAIDNKYDFKIERPYKGEELLGQEYESINNIMVTILDRFVKL